MFLKNTRYKEAAVFQVDAQGELPFRGIRARLPGPATGVVEHTVASGRGQRREGDQETIMNRHDSLAYHYYANDRLWWRILDANPDFVFARDLVAIEQLAGRAQTRAIRQAMVYLSERLQRSGMTMTEALEAVETVLDGEGLDAFDPRRPGDLAEFRRFSADRKISAGQKSEAQRAKAQIARDIEFVTSVRDGTNEVSPILAEALERIEQSVATA